MGKKGREDWGTHGPKGNQHRGRNLLYKVHPAYLLGTASTSKGTGDYKLSKQNRVAKSMQHEPAEAGC